MNLNSVFALITFSKIVPNISIHHYHHLPVVLLALLLLLGLVGGGVARGAAGVVTVVTRHLVSSLSLSSVTIIISIIISHLLVVLSLLDHLYLVDALLAGGHGVEVHADLALALLHLPPGGALQVLNLDRLQLQS